MPTNDGEFVIECVRPSVRRGLFLRPEGVDVWNQHRLDLIVSFYRSQGRSQMLHTSCMRVPSQTERSMTIGKRASPDEKYVFTIEAFDRATKNRWPLVKDKSLEKGSCVLFRPSDGQLGI